MAGAPESSAATTAPAGPSPFHIVAEGWELGEHWEGPHRLRVSPVHGAVVTHEREVPLPPPALSRVGPSHTLLPQRVWIEGAEVWMVAHYHDSCDRGVLLTTAPVPEPVQLEVRECDPQDLKQEALVYSLRSLEGEQPATFAAFGDSDCEGQPCKHWGRCKEVEGELSSGEHQRLRGLKACAEQGLCAAVRGRCIARAKRDCNAARACKDKGRCLLVRGRCVNEN